MSVFFVNYPLTRFAGALVAQTVLLPQGAQVILYGCMPDTNGLGYFLTSNQRIIFDDGDNHIQSRLRSQLLGANFGANFGATFGTNFGGNAYRFFTKNSANLSHGM